MRALTVWLVGGLAALALLSCASTKQPSAAVSAADSSIALADTTAAIAEDLFVERHMALLNTLDMRERTGFDPRLVEARSFVAAAEEMYLRGKTDLALGLLDDADTLLRKGN